ncbi:MAG TPA: LCP family protein [Clostridiaceae bacterium]
MKIKLNKKFKIFFFTLVSLILITSTTYFVANLYVKSHLSKIKIVIIPKDPISTGIDSSTIPAKPNITNILLLGTDSREPKSDPGRADSIIILAIDRDNKKIKMTSLMRDSLVTIEDHGNQKLTHAHAFGGPLLAIKTINQNYNLDITDYVEVNFFGLEKIIGYVGGIPINITNPEINAANTNLSETAVIEHKKAPFLIKPGMQILNGMQAVAYERIRYVGNADFQRTQRQRDVLNTLLKKLSTLAITSIPKAADTMFPYIETSLKTDDIMSLCTYILTNKVNQLEESKVPYDGLYKNQIVNGLDVLVWDKVATIARLHQFIYGDIIK